MDFTPSILVLDATQLGLVVTTPSILVLDASRSGDHHAECPGAGCGC